MKKVQSVRDLNDSKEVIGRLSYEDFALVCEELNVVEDAIRGLWNITITTSDEKIRVDVYKWLIEMNVGKAKQAVDMTSKGEKVTAGIFIDNGESI